MRNGLSHVLAAAIVMSVAGCGPASLPAATATPVPTGSSSPSGTPADSASPLGTPAATPAAVPGGFPLPAGAVQLPVAGEEADLAGRWSVPLDGAMTHDFFVAALPERGFEVTGRFPGGGGALITFRAAAGMTWQLTIEASSPTIVELRPNPG